MSNIKVEPGEEGDDIQTKILALCEAMPEVRRVTRTTRHTRPLQQ